MKIVDSQYEGTHNGQKQSKCSVYKECVKEIYGKRFDINRFYIISRNLTIQLTYGEQYTLIREELMTICKTHRKLIAQSARIRCSSKQTYSILTPQQKQSPIESQLYDQLKKKQAVIWILYHHYKNIAESNKQICIFWDIIHNYRQHEKCLKNDNYFQLKQNILNHLAIKELVPSSEDINLRPLEKNLKQLIDAPFVIKKQHLREMYSLFIESEMTEKRKYNVTKSFQFQSNRIKKVTMRFQGDDWLERSKSDSIGAKLSEILGGRFSQLEKEESNISQKAYEQMSRQLIPKPLLELGLLDDNIEFRYKTVITKKIIRSDYKSQSILSTLRTQQIIADSKEIAELTNKTSQISQANEGNDAEGQKKKKKRKRNKKKKVEQHNELIKVRSEISEMKIEKQIKTEESTLSLDESISRTLQQFNQVDKSSRMQIEFPIDSIQEWRQWAKIYDPI